MKPQANRITELFDISFPIIQAGMVWCSGWRLASAVSNAGGLGLIGSGSMYPEIEKIIQIIIEEQVKIVFTSAGNPATWTGPLKEKGIKVVHVISS
ncbi:MAG TPA: nitronate monooxygenase, partial [Chryseolinea sp.]|nr:nitronate monooxygenase [Chryseolinea sp.]